MCAGRRDYNELTPIMKEQAEVEKPSTPVQQIHALMERVMSQANHVARRPGRGAVHNLRIAIRRLDQALAVCKLHLPRKPVKQIRRQLKTVLSHAGAVRDQDIAIRILSKRGWRGAGGIQRQVKARRKEAEKSLLDVLRQESLQKHIPNWGHNLGLSLNASAISAATLRDIAITALPRLERRFFEAGAQAADHSSGKRLHNFRLRTKKFRYALELLSPVYGSAAEECIHELKRIQTVLGAMNDYRTVRSIAADAGCGEELLTSLKNSEHRKVRQFRAIWADRFSEETQERWIRALQLDHAEQPVPRKPAGASKAIPRKAGAAHA